MRDVPPVARSVADRAIEGLLVCVARYGLAKTSLDDVAREAGCGRATLYRHFANRHELVEATIAALRARLDDTLADAVAPLAARADAPASDALTAVVVATASFVRASPAILNLLDHEPATVLPWLAFDPGRAVLASLGAQIAAPLTPWLALEAPRVGEWLARLLISYLVHADERSVLLDPDRVRALVVAFVLPAFHDSVVLPGRAR